MKRYKKTYAIFHLTEKHTVFYLGKTKVHVSFTGGIVTKRGVTPATYTTDDPIVQFAIEQSADFKKGAISLRSKYPVQGEVKIGKNEPEPPVAEASTQGHTDSEIDGAGTPLLPIEASAEDYTSDKPADAENLAAPLSEHRTQTLDKGSENPEEEAPENKSEETKDEAGLTVVEVSCKDVAKQYLQEHYDEKPAPLRTRADIQECAAKYGITFNFL